MNRFVYLIVISVYGLASLMYPTRVESSLGVIAVLDRADPVSAGFWLQEGVLWWALHSDYAIMDRLIASEPLEEQEYYLLNELAPDRSESIYPVDGNRVFKLFRRDGQNRSHGIYIYRLMKCSPNSCEFVSGTISGPLIVFNDSSDSVDTEHSFTRLPDIVTQVLELTDGRELSVDLRKELGSLRSLQQNDPQDYSSMYDIARSIAVNTEYQSIILGTR